MEAAFKDGTGGGSERLVPNISKFEDHLAREPA